MQNLKDPTVLPGQMGGGPHGIGKKLTRIFMLRSINGYCKIMDVVKHI